MQKVDITTAAERLRARVANLRDEQAQGLATELERLPVSTLSEEKYVTRAVMLTLQLEARANLVN